MSNDTTTIVNTESAKAVVTMVKNQIKNETGKYAAYVKANAVTVDTVGEHVKALRLMAYPSLKASEGDAKRFADKVRLGLRTALGDSPEDRKDENVNLLTRAGLAATLEEVTAAWKSAQK